MKSLLSLLLIVAALLLQGCTTSMSKGADRRTEGTYIDDGYIEDTATSRIKSKYADKVHININSYNRKVLITGEVADENVKTDITRIVGGVQTVMGINNELVVGPQTSLSSRSGDALITSNINLRLRDSGKDLHTERVEVITENGVVYLLGLVTRKEGGIATDVASTSRSVKKVVPLFEYID
ncbi:MAG: BON domain-containing protein [Gallionellaceae bacterium]|jgi:osmotically-inducible protein OsmY